MPSLNSFRLIDPVDQAEVLLTICEDDMRFARSQASYNYRHATGAEAEFWFDVLRVLSPSTAQA